MDLNADMNKNIKHLKQMESQIDDECYARLKVEFAGELNFIYDSIDLLKKQMREQFKQLASREELESKLRAQYTQQLANAQWNQRLLERKNNRLRIKLRKSREQVRTLKQHLLQKIQVFF